MAAEALRLGEPSAQATTPAKRQFGLQSLFIFWLHLSPLGKYPSPRCFSTPWRARQSMAAFLPPRPKFAACGKRKNRRAAPSCPRFVKAATTAPCSLAWPSARRFSLNFSSLVACSSSWRGYKRPGRRKTCFTFYGRWAEACWSSRWLPDSWRFLGSFWAQRAARWLAPSLRLASNSADIHVVCTGRASGTQLHWQSQWHSIPSSSAEIAPGRPKSEPPTLTTQKLLLMRDNRADNSYPKCAIGTNTTVIRHSIPRRFS